MIITPGQLGKRADFYFQVASMLTAGVPIIQALEMARDHARSLREPISTVISKLQTGSTFAEALNATGRWLPYFDRAVIGAGEKSGRLDQTLKTLGNHYQERATLARRIISDMAYPLFLVHMAVLIFPTTMLTKLFVSGGIEAFIVQKISILLPLYLAVFFVIVALQGNRGEAWRAFMERILNAVPLIGGARHSLALARFSAGLEALLSSGVPVIESWQVAGEASGSNRIKRAVGWAVPRMQSGMVPSEAMRQLPVFPELYRNLYTSGEVSGQLDTTLERLYKHYQEQASHRFQSIGQWAPKLVFLIIAIAIGYQVVTFWSGYYGQIGNMEI